MGRFKLVNKQNTIKKDFLKQLSFIIFVHELEFFLEEKEFRLFLCNLELAFHYCKVQIYILLIAYKVQFLQFVLQIFHLN